ncbi:MAG: DUF2231 domain-containing protein [Gammaproteobacteria bacterium]|nr:DUF2231 domain-containing protein [Gammaproteobacteria bacterium]
MARIEPITSRVVLFGHPLHPALVHFPIAALVGLVGTDLAYVLTGDFFWARAGLWLAGTGAAGGTIAGLVGLLDLLTVWRIRRLVTAGIHAVLAVMLLSLAALNWLLRFGDPAANILPWGLYLSVLSFGLIMMLGHLGARLVYEYAVGVDLDEAMTAKPKP